jgi:hypothetical protein
MSTPLIEPEGADPAPSIPPVSCPFCGATYRRPVEAITRATPPLQALVCELLSMLQQGQLAPGFSHEDWLAWLAKARRAVHLSASPP